MNRLPSLISALALGGSLSLQAQIADVDFSAYATPTTLGTSQTDAGGNTFSSAVLQDANGDTAYTYYQGFNSINGSTATYSGVVQGPGSSSDNYLEMIAARSATGGGQPFSNVSATTTFDPNNGGVMTWSSTFEITQNGGNGGIRFGLYSGDAINGIGSYDITETQSGGAAQTALSINLLGNGNIQTFRRSGGERQTWNEGSDIWDTGSTNGAWSLDTEYEIILTANTNTGILTAELIAVGSGSTLVDATTDISDIDASALLGGLRASFGNLENNSTSGYVVQLSEITIVPEPSGASLVIAASALLIGFRRRRRS